jgi:phage antirepressor YoqD-like protein
MLDEIHLDMKKVSEILKLKINGKLVGRNELFKLLRKKKVLQEGNNLPYKKFLSEGYFEVKELEIERPGQYIKTGYKTTVSLKGMQFIKELLNG